MPIKHEWRTSRNLPASVSCSGPSLDVPGEVTIDIPTDPLQSERMTMALEILNLREKLKAYKSRRPYPPYTIPSRGVYPYGVFKKGSKYRAQVYAGGKYTFLGYYDSWAVASAIALYHRNLLLGF